MKTLFKQATLRLTALVLSGVMFLSLGYPGISSHALWLDGWAENYASPTDYMQNRSGILDQDAGGDLPIEPDNPDEMETPEAPNETETPEEPGQIRPPAGTGDPDDPNPNENGSAPLPDDTENDANGDGLLAEVPNIDDPDAPYELEDGSSVIVYTFADLKRYLEDDDTFSTIYLGTDIAMQAGGIKVNSRTGFVLDGCPPGSPAGTRHTLTDITGDYNQIILIPVASPVTSITARNIQIEGHNLYGTIASSKQGVELIFENVFYTGPQMVYNINGTTRLRDVDVVLTGVDEVAETAHLFLGGNTTLTHKGTNNSTFWLRGSDTSLTFEAGSNVVIYSERETFYCDSPPDVVLEMGAQVELNTAQGFNHRDQTTNSLTLQMGSKLYARQTSNEGNADFAVMRIRNKLLVENGATLEVYHENQYTKPAITFTQNGAEAIFNNPARVIIFSKNQSPLYFYGITGHLNITTQGLNIANRGTLPADNIGVELDGIWNRSNLQSFELTGTYLNADTQSFFSTLGHDPINSLPLDKTTFDMAKIRYLTFGSFLLDIDPIFHDSESITGETYGGGEVNIDYTNGGVHQELDGLANSAGRFSIAVPDSPLDYDMPVYFTAHHHRLQVRAVTHVELRQTLAFYEIPASLDFERTPVSFAPHYVHRTDNSFRLGIIDTRLGEKNWYLYASIRTPLTASAGEWQDTLPGALVYVDSSGRRALTSEAILIHSGQTTADDPVSYVSWARSEGPLIFLSGQQVTPGVAYTTTIEWTLLDTPA